LRGSSIKYPLTSYELLERLNELLQYEINFTEQAIDILYYLLVVITGEEVRQVVTQYPKIVFWSKIKIKVWLELLCFIVVCGFNILHYGSVSVRLFEKSRFRFSFRFQLSASATQRTMNGFLCFNALQR